MRDRFVEFVDGRVMAVSDIPTNVITYWQRRGPQRSGGCQGDLTEEAWRDRLEIELIARGLEC